MIRPLVAIAAVTVALTTLAACGSDNSSSSATTAAATTAALATTVAPATTTTAKAAATTTAAAATTTAAAATTTAKAATTAVALTDPDQVAAATAWSTVFDSSVAPDAKAAYLEDPAALTATLTAYAATGQQVGGIALAPTAVAVAGDTATITYDINFAGQPAYQAQSGTTVRQGDGWIVTNAQFCSFMATARTPCAP